MSPEQENPAVHLRERAQMARDIAGGELDRAAELEAEASRARATALAFTQKAEKFDLGAQMIDSFALASKPPA